MISNFCDNLELNTIMSSLSFKHVEKKYEPATKGYYSLPDEILSLIYDFKGHCEFASKDTESEIDYMSWKMKNKNPELSIKNYIESYVINSLSDEEKQWRNRNLSLPSENHILSANFYIYIYPKNNLVTKYKVIHKSVDVNKIDLVGPSFDGFVCSTFDKGFYDWDKFEGMRVKNIGCECGLFLYTYYDFRDDHGYEINDNYHRCNLGSSNTSDNNIIVAIIDNNKNHTIQYKKYYTEHYRKNYYSRFKSYRQHKYRYSSDDDYSDDYDSDHYDSDS